MLFMLTPKLSTEDEDVVSSAAFKFCANLLKLYTDPACIRSLHIGQNCEFLIQCCKHSLQNLCPHFVSEPEVISQRHIIHIIAPSKSSALLELDSLTNSDKYLNLPVEFSIKRFCSTNDFSRRVNFNSTSIFFNFSLSKPINVGGNTESEIC
ncbi:hypothetical protein LELG_02442 [Lodderomyces elongisporus NRRL YB-4239]|uniref:Uncharacterized protein n=1 Tax=Lodderomyces elongisporus (strain ATCC 11503 / CBS 2605 / JCM 1781 / NBRC 1676 / NRRL YB-4239) TaxID=379508 RepID=A5DYK5_LODEL|nr:hypothetical protein LELG_02442 [Lodderomyces elongisporus NRRL YB-4239]